jgi:hypothetical protein
MIFKFFFEKDVELLPHAPKGRICFFFDNIFAGFVKKICQPLCGFDRSLAYNVAHQDFGIIFASLLEGIAIGKDGFIRQIRRA